MNLPSDASNDQSNCPPGYYRRNTGMLHQLEVSTTPESQNKPIPNLTDEELRTMAREKLSELLQGIVAKDSPSLLLSVCREILDRLEGKPTQRVEQKIEYRNKTLPSELTNSQLIEALRKANIAGLLPANVKLLENGDVVTEAYYVDVTDNQ